MVSFSNVCSSVLLLQFINLTNMMNVLGSIEEGHSARFTQSPWFYNSKVPQENCIFGDLLYCSTDSVTHFCHCDLSCVPRHCRAHLLAVLPLQKEGWKDEQLSSTLGFIGLCPGARHWTRRLLYFKEWSISHPWVAPKHPIMLWEGRKEMGNSGDPFVSVLWKKPETAQCGTILMAFSCSGTLSDAKKTACV